MIMKDFKEIKKWLADADAVIVTKSEAKRS